MSLPSPWAQITFSTAKPQFTNYEDGTSSRVDPRRRAFPAEEINVQGALRSSQYLKVYNANPSTCEGYWGHQGGKSTTDFRIKPALFMLSFLGSAFTLFAAGEFCVFQYPHNLDKTIQLPNLTLPDIERIITLLRLKKALMVSSAPLIPLIVVYTLFSVGSILTLWGYAILENMPEEYKQEYQEMLRRRQFLEASRQPRIQEESDSREHQERSRQPRD